MDRARVQAFLLRWVFGGTVSPLPLENGITVLNIGHGSGMWQPGHHMIDLALDYRESLFVTIEICDLLPDDFEEEEEKINKDIVEISSNQFTPIHPSLPIKLQTTTKPHNESANSFSSSNTNSIFVQETDGDIKDYMEKPVKRHLLKNLDFYRMNVMKECLPFEDNQFDFVKQRLATAAFTLDNWKHVLAEMLRVTKPGGWIGLLEIDLSTVNLGSHGTQFEEQMAEAARSIGIEPRMAIYLTEILKALGLEEIKKQSVSIPLGEWGLNLGTLWKNNLESFAESLEPLISKLMKLSKEEYKEKWRIYFEEALHTKPFSNAYIVLGRKPLGNDSTIDWSLCPVFGQK